MLWLGGVLCLIPINDWISAEYYGARRGSIPKKYCCIIAPSLPGCITSELLETIIWRRISRLSQGKRVPTLSLAKALFLMPHTTGIYAPSSESASVGYPSPRFVERFPAPSVFCGQLMAVRIGRARHGCPTRRTLCPSW